MIPQPETKGRFIPWICLALVAAMAYGFWIEVRAARVGLLPALIDDFDFSWYEFFRRSAREWPTLISHLFFHGDIGHLASNVVFFLFFGPEVEKRLGWGYFTAGFLIWGAGAALVQGYFTPFSPGLIGASGAISGCAGAYFVLYPLKTPLSVGLARLGAPFFSKIPAFFWILLWLGIQVKGGLVSILPLFQDAEVTRIGYWAHVGGFFLGALWVAPLVFKKQG